MSTKVKKTVPGNIQGNTRGMSELVDIDVNAVDNVVDLNRIFRPLSNWLKMTVL
jgi:hypothetical protein